MLRKIGATGFGQFDAPIVNNASIKHFFLHSFEQLKFEIFKKL